jgi:hypothetical protein
LFFPFCPHFVFSCPSSSRPSVIIRGSGEAGPVGGKGMLFWHYSGTSLAQVVDSKRHVEFTLERESGDEDSKPRNLHVGHSVTDV